MAVSTTYYVIPDHYSSHHFADNNTFTLQYYLNNTSKYFTSHNQLHFLPGQYYINSDLVFKEIYNFSLTGHKVNQSVIICSSPASIIAINADSFTMQNIVLIDCKSLLKILTDELYYISALFSYCSSVTMNNVYVNVSSDDTTELIGMYMVNVAESEIINVKVQVNILMCHNHPVTISGLSIYNNHRTKVQLPGVIIETFNYYAPKSCLKYSQCAIMCKIFM